MSTAQPISLSAGSQSLLQRLPVKPIVMQVRRQIATDCLFAPGERELTLLHEGAEYRLRITQQGKLLLTK